MPRLVTIRLLGSREIGESYGYRLRQATAGSSARYRTVLVSFFSLLLFVWYLYLLLIGHSARGRPSRAPTGSSCLRLVNLNAFDFTNKRRPQVCLRASALYLTTIGSKSMSCSRLEYSKRPLPPRPLLVDTGVASSQVTQQLQFQVPTYSQSQSQSHLYSPQEKRQSQHLCTMAWSAHAPRLQVGQPPSPFLRQFHALSTSATATGELFLFGGYVHKSWSPNNDLYAISTRDFSTTLLQTSGDVPSPRYGHHAVLTSTTLLIWGGRTDFRDQNAQNQNNDDSFYLLNLRTSYFFNGKTGPS